MLRLDSSEISAVCVRWNPDRIPQATVTEDRNKVSSGSSAIVECGCVPGIPYVNQRHLLEDQCKEDTNCREYQDDTEDRVYSSDDLIDREYCSDQIVNKDNSVDNPCLRICCQSEKWNT